MSFGGLALVVGLVSAAAVAGLGPVEVGLEAAKQAGGEGCAELEGVSHGDHFGFGVLGESAGGIPGGGEVVHLVAERGADRGDLVGVDQRHHSGGRLDPGDTAGGVDGHPDRVTAGR